MKRALIAVFVVVVLPSASFAQTKAHDGNWWIGFEGSIKNDDPVIRKTVADVAKTWLLQGVIEGTVGLGHDMLIEGLLAQGSDFDAAKKADAAYDAGIAKLIVNVGFGQIFDGLNEFYGDFRNRSIGINGAVGIVLRQIAGYPPQKIDELVIGLRERTREVQ